jgi:membrane protease YdiL (CAAX protease family)
MNDSETNSILLAGVLALVGLAVLAVQYLPVQKKHGDGVSPVGQIRPWSGTTPIFLLLVATVVLVFLFVVTALAAGSQVFGMRGTYSILLIGIGTQLAVLTVVCILPRQINPEFRFQCGGQSDKAVGWGERLFGKWGVFPCLVVAVGVPGGMALVVREIGALLRRITGSSFGLDEAQQAVEELMKHRDDGLYLGLMTLSAVVLAPVLEELFFRGLVYPFLKSRTGAWVSICVTGFIFGAIHFNVAAFLPLMFFGAYLCVIYEKTRDIRIPIAVHALFNLSTTLFVVFDVG